MRKINPAFITSLAKQPFTQGTWVHLQLAYQEAIAAIMQGQIGSAYDPTIVYIIFGCVATGADPGARTFSAGAVFFNGEIYLVPATSYTSSGSNVAVGTIVTTPYTGTGGNADPLEFTDLSTHNVHDIRTMNITAASAGSGTADFSTWKKISQAISNSSIAGASITTGTGTIVSSSLFIAVKGGFATLNFQIELTATAGGYYNLSFPLPIVNTNVNVYSSGVCFREDTRDTVGAYVTTGAGTPYNILIFTGALIAAKTYLINGEITFPLV